MGITNEETDSVLSDEDIPKAKLSKKSAKLYSMVNFHKKKFRSVRDFKTKDTYGLDSNKSGNLNSISLENLVSNKKATKDIEAACETDDETGLLYEY